MPDMATPTSSSAASSTSVTDTGKEFHSPDFHSEENRRGALLPSSTHFLRCIPVGSYHVSNVVLEKLVRFEGKLEREPFYDRLTGDITDLAYHGLVPVYFYLYLFQFQPCTQAIAPLSDSQKLQVCSLLACVYNLNERTLDALDRMRVQWSRDSSPLKRHTPIPEAFEDEFFVRILEGCTLHLVADHKWVRISAAVHVNQTASAATTPIELEGESAPSPYVCKWVFRRHNLTRLVRKWEQTEYNLDAQPSEFVRWTAAILQIERQYHLMDDFMQCTLFRLSPPHAARVWHALVCTALDQRQWAVALRLLSIAEQMRPGNSISHVRDSIRDIYRASLIDLMEHRLSTAHCLGALRAWLKGDNAADGRVIRQLWVHLLAAYSTTKPTPRGVQIPDLLDVHWKELFPLREPPSRA